MLGEIGSCPQAVQDLPLAFRQVNTYTLLRGFVLHYFLDFVIFIFISLFLYYFFVWGRGRIASSL